MELLTAVMIYVLLRRYGVAQAERRQTGPGKRPPAAAPFAELKLQAEMPGLQPGQRGGG
jgi:hypothetical protein